MMQESSHERRRPHRVVVIVDENSNPFELGCATEVFGLRRPEIGRELYDFHLCSPEPRTLMRDGFFTLTGVAELALADTADTLIVPNRPDVEVPRRPAVLDAVRRAHGRGARLVGFCSGAFTLAEAGVLDGRRATAHWQWADSFRAASPAYGSSRTCCSSTTATSSRRRGAPPRSIWGCMWCAGTTARRSPTR
ncbi:DJ-1/PfpI family protein [Streptomyces niveus]|uniref:DJ-1/PfpI family protein n=1 Tax=Streptomyces niveus TaxID=193462 RepID=UPI0036B7379C